MLEFLIPNNMICHAVEAMLFASVGCAILAVLITQMKISSIGFTMAHGAFAGAAVGMFFGIDMTIAALIGSVLLAFILGPLSEKSRMPTDTTLGVLFGSMMAVAIFFYAWMQQLGISYNATALMFGSVISLYREEIYGLFIIMLVVIVFVMMFYKEISAMIFNRKIAEVAGIRTKPMMYALLFMIALMVALTLPIVGGLLLYVWVVTPAAIAYQFCGTLKQMMIVSPVIAAIVSLCGTFVSFSMNLPVAPFSAVLFALVFAAAVILSPKRRIAKTMIK
ncbi:metal ABC transporter permease [Methanorbis rubei]|uniref:Manganese transport system membrane protein MntB n=1 Tax=Methanorbis rubei TaxID=3028300 RepID=A0AAE4MFQ8_9EURY|nr:Manganese transport system membrane protein MntB [Methanocorpusculaceae archaeon Cs1]